MDKNEIAENWNTIIVCIAFNGAMVVDVSPNKFNILFWDKNSGNEEEFRTFIVNKTQLKKIYKEARELRVEADYMLSQKEKENITENEEEVVSKKKASVKRTALEKKQDLELARQEDIEFPEDGPEPEPYDQI